MKSVEKGELPRIVKIAVVGSVILHMNTDNPDDLRNGWTGKVLGELSRVDDGKPVKLWQVRWYNGTVDDDVLPAHCVHV